MNTFSLLCILINISGVFMTIVRPGAYSTTYKSSCLQIKESVPSALSGLYDIMVGNRVVTVYCEMAKAGGGFTFIPREAVKRGQLSALVHQVFIDRTEVLLRFQRKDGLQPFTLITQLSENSRTPLTVWMHSYFGHTRPVNTALGDYLFLGIMPANKLRARSRQGFRSNGQNITFTNCDKNPNSYFAFFPNHQEGAISSYHRSNLFYERRGVAVNWRRTGVFSYGHRQLPNNFFFLTELHFGGCGTYTSSDRWGDAFGAAIGLR